MKKMIAILCAVLLLVSMTACGGSDDGNYTIGICQVSTSDALDAATEGFMQALKDELGEDNVEFDLRNAEGDSNACATIAGDFVSDEVDLILANDTLALQAAAAATSEIPVVGTCVADYGAALSIENFSGTVGGNVSGTSDLVHPLDQAVMVVEWFMEAENVGMVYCANDPDSKYQADAVEKFLEDAGVNCEHFTFTDSSDLASAVQAACDTSGLIYVPSDAAVAAGADIIDSICRPAGIPVIGGDESICKACGITAMAVDYYALGVQTGQMAAKILKGEANISEMPIESTDFAQVYNADICAELGLTPPLGYDPMA